MYRYVRKYAGPLKACILDWSGTTADKYVIAPAVVFQDVFHKYGVPFLLQIVYITFSLLCGWWGIAPVMNVF